MINIKDEILENKNNGSENVQFVFEWNHSTPAVPKLFLQRNLADSTNVEAPSTRVATFVAFALKRHCTLWPEFLQNDYFYWRTFWRRHFEY